MSVTRKFTLYVNHSPQPARPQLITKSGLDVVNSVCWLFMDALWLFGFPKVGIILAVPAILTCFLLLYVERHRPVSFINLATNCWVWMNVFWMLSDTFAPQEAIFLLCAKTMLSLGLFFVVYGGYKSGGLMKSVTHYKSYKRFQFSKTLK